MSQKLAAPSTVGVGAVVAFPDGTTTTVDSAGTISCPDAFVSAMLNAGFEYASSDTGSISTALSTATANTSTASSSASKAETSVAIQSSVASLLTVSGAVASSVASRIKSSFSW